MPFIRKMINFFILAYTVCTNRKNYNMVNVFLQISEEIANKTKTKIDDNALACLATFIKLKTNNLSDADQQSISRMVNSVNKGPLKDIKVDLDNKKGVKINTPAGDIKYNPKDGSVSFGVGLNW